MNIETKHLVALVVLVALGSGGFLATLLSQRMRDLALFGFVFCAVLIDRMNIVLFGQFWYRGSSRGVEISAIDVLPLCLFFSNLLLPRYRRGRFFWPASLALLVVYFIYCCISVSGAYPQHYGVWELAKMFRGLLVFLAAATFIRSRREVGVLVAALGCAVCLEGFNAIEQRFTKGVFRAPGTLNHENTLSTYLCTVAPVLLAAAMSNWSKWLRWFAGVSCFLAAAGEVLTLSRLGVPVFALVMAGTALACTSWQITKRKVAIVALTLACVGGMVAVSWDGLRARYASSNITAEFTDEKAVDTRGVYWRIAFLILQDHPTGVGLNNWSYWVAKSYGSELGYSYTDYDDIKWIPTKEDARETNFPPSADALPALTLGELGYIGLGLFLLIWLRWFQMGAVFLGNRLNPDPYHRIAIGCLFGTLGIFLQSATEWTYRQTSVHFTFHVLMGALAAMYFARRQTKVEAKKLRHEETELAHERVDPVTVPMTMAHSARLLK